MSEKELHRAAVLARVQSGQWSLVEAAERTTLSYRQAKREWKQYREHGGKGLLHGNAGKRSNRATPPHEGSRSGREVPTAGSSRAWNWISYPWTTWSFGRGYPAFTSLHSSIAPTFSEASPAKPTSPSNVSGFTNVPISMSHGGKSL